MLTDSRSDRDLIARCWARLDRAEYVPLVEEMATVLESRPDFAEGFFATGYARMKLGELPLAASCFSRVACLKPDLTSVHRLYFPILWRLNRKAELEAALNIFVRSDASGHDADIVRGTWLHQLGRSQEATHHLFLAVIQKPEAKEPYRLLGGLMEDSQNLRQAERILNIGLLLGDDGCGFPLTRVLKGLNRFEDSVTLARRMDLDRLHFRSGATVGSLDRGDIVDLDGYDFAGAAEIDAAALFDSSTASDEKPAGPDKWHYRSKEISFFPRSVDDFADLKKLVRDHVISRSIPDQPIFASESNILTMGSCFAGHLRKRLLAKSKSTELISVPEGLNNTFALRQFIDWSLTGTVDTNAYWYDQLEDGGIERWMPPEEHSFYREKFSEFDGFVITIGLSEVWRDKETGGVFWRGVPQGIFDEGRHAFQISTVEENTDNMLAIVDLVRRHCGAKPVVFTLSPVPLIATHRSDVTCMLADSVSKSILRVAIDQVMRRQMEDVYYWPSFEIVRWASGHADYRAFGDDDGAPRHVNDGHVNAIIDAFIEHFFRGA